MQCKWWTHKWPTGHRIKKNMCRCTKDKHYTCYRVWIGLCFIHSNSKNTSLGPLWSLDSLSPRTTTCHRSWWLCWSHCWPAKTLNRSTRLRWWLTYKSSIAQKWAVFLNMTSLTALKTYSLRHTVNSWMKLLTMGHLLDIILPLKAELGGEIPNLKGCEVLKVWRELIELVSNLDKLSEDSKLRLFLDDCFDTNSNPFLFWNFPRDILSLVNFSTLKVSCIISL